VRCALSSSSVDIDVNPLGGIKCPRAGSDGHRDGEEHIPRSSSSILLYSLLAAYSVTLDLVSDARRRDLPANQSSDVETNLISQQPE